jgi:hypothetical protein
MIALQALIGGPSWISGPAEPLVRSIRIPLRRKLLSEAGLELRVVPSAPLLILGEDIPGLVAVTPASAAAAKFAYARTADLGTVSGIQSAAYAIDENGEIVASGSHPTASSTRSCSPSSCPRPGPTTRPPDSRRTERPLRRAGITQTI